MLAGRGRGDSRCNLNPPNMRRAVSIAWPSPKRITGCKQMPPANQNPEQIARDQIDACLVKAGWRVQTMKSLDWSAGQGIAVREYQTDTGPADYVLFVD